MKRLILLFFLAFITLTSCSSDENFTTNEPISTIKPTKIVATYSGSGATQVYTSTYTYSGNKIIEEQIVPNYDTSKIKYTYSGNYIIKIEKFRGENFDLIETTTFTYENGKVKSRIIQGTGPFPYNKDTFTHDAAGTIYKTSVDFDPTTGNETHRNESGKFYFTNRNLTKKELIDANGNVKLSETYTYDNGKFDAFRNVTGFDKIVFAGNNNLASSLSPGALTVLSTYTSTYDTFNYPIQIERVILNSTRIQIITY